MSIKIRLKSLSKGAKSVYLDIYHHGKRHYEFLEIHIHRNDSQKKEKLQLAEKIRSQREIEIYRSEYGFTPTSKKNKDFIEYYESFILNYTGKDIRLVQYSLNKFKLMSGGRRMSFASLTPKVCMDYARYLKNSDNGLSGETPYNYFMKFRRVIKDAMVEGFIRENPAANIVVRRKTNQLKKNVLSTDELKSLARTICNHSEVKRAFLFCCYTGLGAAELRKLKSCNIQNGRIIILRQKSKEQIILDLHSAAVSLLGDLTQNDPESSLFALPTDTTISKHLKNWIKSAGIKKNISFYCARHTFATQLLLHGANLKTVADCLGHSTTNHTIKYLNYVDEMKSDAIRNLPNLED